jgi:hypothetical protein
MTTVLCLKPNSTSSKIDRNDDSNLNNTRHLIENINVIKFYELNANEEEKDNNEITDDISYTLYIVESRRHECPKLKIKIAGEEIQVLIDMGCEMSILNENVHNELRHAGLKCPEIPIQRVNLVNAFNNRSKNVKKQALLEIDIGSTNLEEVTLLSTQLLGEASLGLDFLINYQAEISFPERRIALRLDEEVFNFEFIGAKETIANGFCNLGLMSIDSQTRQPSTAVKKVQGYTKNFATGGGDESFQDWNRDTGTCMEDSEYFIDHDNECECVLNDDNEASMQQRKKDCTGNTIATKYERRYKFFSKELRYICRS